MAITWWLADLKTGDVIDTLPLSVGSIDHTINAESSTSGDLPIKDASLPANWANMIDARRQMLVPVDETPDGQQVPLLGYLITEFTPGEPEAPIGLRSLEHALARVYCRDHYFDQVDASRIFETLCTDVLVPSWEFELVVTDCGLAMDQEYFWLEDRTVASAITDLTQAEGGPDYLARIAWADGQVGTRFTKTIEIGPKVGRDMATTVIENGHLSTRTRPRNWSEFATHVIATGDGSGESRPMSAPVVDEQAHADGIPQWETRHAATSIADEAILDIIAAGEANRRRYGSRSWELEILSADPRTPRVGRDFDAGDTVHMDLGPWRLSQRRTFDQGFGIGRFGAGTFGIGEGAVVGTDVVLDPATWHGPARLAGWRARISERTITHVTPVFWDEEGER